MYVCFSVSGLVREEGEGGGGGKANCSLLNIRFIEYKII